NCWRRSWRSCAARQQGCDERRPKTASWSHRSRTAAGGESAGRDLELDRRVIKCRERAGSQGIPLVAICGCMFPADRDGLAVVFESAAAPKLGSSAAGWLTVGGIEAARRYRQDRGRRMAAD